MAPTNCWDFMKCGREPGGSKSGVFGVCPAPVAFDLDGIHGGRGGGRACWAVEETRCGGRLKGAARTDPVACLSCAFYACVREHEGERFLDREALLKLMAHMK